MTRVTSLRSQFPVTTAPLAMAQRVTSFDDVLHIPATREDCGPLPHDVPRHHHRE